MKKIFLSILISIFASTVFAIDFTTTSTRILETLTSDEIFVAQAANSKELVLVLEKGYKEVFGPERTSYYSKGMDFEKKVTDIISHMETKKQYNEMYEKSSKRVNYCVFDRNHTDFTYDQMVEIINTFKGRLGNEKVSYYVTFMKDGNSSDCFIFVYDAKTKKIYMERTDGYVQSWDDWNQRMKNMYD